MSWLFWIVFCLFVFVGLFVLLTNNPVHSILALVLVFFLSSCLVLALGAEFLAILILIVYVGAISVLFLFVVMLLNIRILELNVSLVKYWWLGVLYTSFFFFTLVYALWPIYFSSTSRLPTFIDLIGQTSDWGAVSQFGEIIFLYFPNLLIIAALILFLAIVSPVLLTYVTFYRSSASSALSVTRRQDIFSQTLRLSVDKHF